MSTMILGSKYNTREGLLICGSLEKQWIVDHLYVNPNRSKKNAKYYDSVDLHEVTKQQIVNKKSVLSKEKIDMLIIFGKTKETFDELDINITGVEAMEIQFSKSRI